MIPLIEQEVQRQREVRLKEKEQNQAELIEAMTAYKSQLRDSYCGAFSAN